MATRTRRAAARKNAKKAIRAAKQTRRRSTPTTMEVAPDQFDQSLAPVLLTLAQEGADEVAGPEVEEGHLWAALLRDGPISRGGRGKRWRTLRPTASPWSIPKSCGRWKRRQASSSCVRARAPSRPSHMRQRRISPPPGRRCSPTWNPPNLDRPRWDPPKRTKTRPEAEQKRPRSETERQDTVSSDGRRCSQR